MGIYSKRICKASVGNEKLGEKVKLQQENRKIGKNAKNCP
jgi:hypothetical protein